MRSAEVRITEVSSPILQKLPPDRMAPMRPEFPDDPNEFQRVRVDREGPGVEEDVAVRAQAEDIVRLVGTVVGPTEGADVGTF
jgi:hypothetical protein